MTFLIIIISLKNIKLLLLYNPQSLFKQIIFMKKTAITPTRAENYPEWYQQVITAADLAETTPVRGCMVIKPWGYAIWENIQKLLDLRFKETGHVNAYFPLLIPLSYLEKEAAHIDGFAKECAVVTHHRLKGDGKGKLIPDGELEEPYIIRPTSETIIGVMYAKWIQSYRDLPVLINQWANVMRWEMRTRLFLRTSEFLWQEGHTAHATAEEARIETLTMLHIYADFAENMLAMPVIRGEKTETERFPGAINTYCIEAMMQDGKALQAGTSHFLGQHFSKAYDIQFLDQQGQQQHVWTTSWGVSTRLIGGLIMTHSDDDGLVLPPKIAPQQVVILPIYRDEASRQTVMEYCETLKKELTSLFFNDQKISVFLDARDMRGGEKSWHWIKKGVPIRLEIGPRDIENNLITGFRRDEDPKQKHQWSRAELIQQLPDLLEDMQQVLFKRAQARNAAQHVEVESLEDFNALFNKQDFQGFVSCYAANNKAVDDLVSPLKVTARCIPLKQDHQPGRCIFTGETVPHKIVFAKAY